MQLFLFEPKIQTRSVDHLFEFSPIKSLDELDIRKHSGRGYPKCKVIYFLFKDDVLTYIGSTTFLADRLRKHRHRGRKFDSLGYLKINPRYEKLMIRLFKPVENRYLC